ncbi:MAG: argininosuccinate lyase, partial [Mucispirillum sp.]|nr:argininosuccinate lyase [Mucispirillum sp.]
IVGKTVAYAIDNNKNLEDLSVNEMQMFSKFIENDVYNYITLDASVNSRNSYGGTSAESVMTQVKLAKSFLDDNL